MKKSQLKEIILEELKGYSKYVPGGVTKGGTTGDFHQILTAIAKSGQEEKDDFEDMNENSEEGQDTYLVHFRIGEDEEDYIEVKASSEEEAIQKVKSGEVKLAYGQSLPRLARSFSAEKWNK